MYVYMYITTNYLVCTRVAPAVVVVPVPVPLLPLPLPLPLSLPTLKHFTTPSPHKW